MNDPRSIRSELSTLPGTALAITESPGAIRALGDLDAYTTPLLADAIGRCGQRVRLDLAEVPFIDGAGIGLLVRTRRHTVEAGGTLEILRPSRAVRRMLELTGTASLFVIDDEPVGQVRLSA